MFQKSQLFISPEKYKSFIHEHKDSLSKAASLEKNVP